MKTETWFFPTKVHLRMRDQSLLKFEAGPQAVPYDLPELEKEILKRNGAKPIESVNKTSTDGAELTAGASAEVEGTSGQAGESEGQGEDSTSKPKVSKKK